MRYLKFIGAACLVLALGATAPGVTVSFLYEDGFTGVDGDTSGWSTGDGVVDLGTSWSLLAGTALVAGYDNGDEILTHRGTRGLGVKGYEDDEVDRKGRPERIEITFDPLDHYVNSVEVRSLYAKGSVDTWGTEQGTIDFYLNGSVIYTENLSGIQSTGNGVLAISYGTPKLVDKLVYYVPQGLGDISTESEFAVAKLDVTPIPEPLTILGVFLGVAGLGAYIRKRRTA